MNKIVAVVGMCGSGKSVLTDMFVKDGFAKVYFGGLTIEELNKRGLEKNEQNERSVREELRAQLGQGAFAIKLYDRINALAQTSDVILDGLYSMSELIYLKDRFKDNLTVLAVVTNSQTRYDRLAVRPIRPLTKENAVARDLAEINNIEKGGPIAIADYYVVNNGSQDQLAQQYSQFISFLRQTR